MKIPPSETRQEEDMSQRTRRGFLLSLIVPFTLTAQACTTQNAAQKVADRFMDAYYVQINVKDALPFTEGLAKEKLAGQIQLMAGDGGPDSAVDKPRVSVSLMEHKSPSADSVIFVYEVKTHVSELGKRTVFLKLRQDGGKWIITQFTEDDAPPS